MNLKFITSIVVLFMSLQIGKSTCTSAPSTLSESQNGAQVTFTWNDVGASSYIIEIRDPQYPWTDPDVTFRETLTTTTYDFPFSIQGFSFE